jgi:hypothetical protein
MAKLRRRKNALLLADVSAKVEGQLDEIVLHVRAEDLERYLQLDLSRAASQEERDDWLSHVMAIHLIELFIGRPDGRPRQTNYSELLQKRGQGGTDAEFSRQQLGAKTNKDVRRSGSLMQRARKSR